MIKTEWKEFYRVIETDRVGQWLKLLCHNLENYDEAVKIGKESNNSFKVDKYFKQVEVEPVYEYQVLFFNDVKDTAGRNFFLTDRFFLSKEDFESKISSHCKFIELVQATKRERK